MDPCKIDFSLRPATLSDLDACCAIAEQAMRDSVERTWGTWNSLEQDQRVRDYFDAQTHQMVMQADQTIGLLVIETEATCLPCRLIGETCLPCRLIGETCLPCRLIGETCLPCRLIGETCLPCRLIGETYVLLAKLYLLASYQNQGIGTQLIRYALAEASKQKKPLRLRVLKANHRAKALYEREGFAVYDQSETHWMMQSQLSRTL
jgi:ribosomal protein S18 acetylase RimI-like enzyme